MSDDLTDLAQHSGWLAAVGWLATTLTGIWGFMLRWIIGRHIRQFDRLDEKLDSIDLRLSIIEGRFEERDTGRYRTRPGDSR